MNVRSALIVMIGLMGIGGGMVAAAISFKEQDRVVSVRGLAEREVPADRVIWPLAFKELGNDLPQLYRVLEKNNGEVIRFLRESGIDSTEISFSAPQVEDLATDGFRDSNKPLPFRYRATSVVTVASPQVQRVRELMQRRAELLLKGIAPEGNEWSYRPVFHFTGLNAIKPAMIEEATKNAREAAEKFAFDSGSRIGKIRSAAQGQFTVDDRDSNSPHMKTVRVVTRIDYALKD